MGPAQLKKGLLASAGDRSGGTAWHSISPCPTLYAWEHLCGVPGALLATGLHVPWGGLWLPASTGEIRVIVKNKQLEVYYQRTIFG